MARKSTFSVRTEKFTDISKVLAASNIALIEVAAVSETSINLYQATQCTSQKKYEPWLLGIVTGYKRLRCV